MRYLLCYYINITYCDDDDYSNSITSMRSTQQGEIVRLEGWLRLVVDGGVVCAEGHDGLVVPWAGGDVRDSSTAVDTCRQWCGCACALCEWHLRFGGGYSGYTHYRPLDAVTIGTFPGPWHRARTRSNIFINEKLWKWRTTYFFFIIFIIRQKRYCYGLWLARNLNGKHSPVTSHQQI